MKTSDTLTIGQVAVAFGLTVKDLIFLGETGLIQPINQFSLEQICDQRTACALAMGAIVVRKTKSVIATYIEQQKGKWENEPTAGNPVNN